MPALIDYASRFEFLRMASFSVARRCGLSALSRRAIAAELGMDEAGVRRVLAADADLAVLAAENVVTRRRGRAMREPSPVERGTPLAALVSLLPISAPHADTELVWLRILLAIAPEPGADPDGPLLHRHTVARGGWIDPGQRPEPDGTAPERQVRRGALRRFVDDRDDQVRDTVERAVGADPDDVDLATAVVDGLAWAVCRGRLAPERALELVADYLARTQQGPDVDECDGRTPAAS